MRVRQLSVSRPSVGPRAGRFDPNVEDVPWVTEGVIGGLVGAATIAGFFLLLDLAIGRPLATPNGLGAALFLGAIPPPHEPTQPVLVAGYTVMHGALFVAVGLAAAFELFTGTRIPGDKPWVRGLVLASSLFLLFEAGSLLFGSFVEPAVQQVVGVWRASIANLLAAATMATFLRARGERLGLHPDAAP
jgi:hypothetical protein